MTKPPEQKQDDIHEDNAPEAKDDRDPSTDPWKERSTEEIDLDKYQQQFPDEASDTAKELQQIFRQDKRPAIALYITGDARPRIVMGQQEILIGRGDPHSHIRPDIDLRDAHGHQRTVSRRHAKITFSDGVSYIEDLSSSNGTWVDEQKLVAFVPKKVSSGSFVRFGKLSALLYVLHASKRDLNKDDIPDE